MDVVPNKIADGINIWDIIGLMGFHVDGEVDIDIAPLTVGTTPSTEASSRTCVAGSTSTKPKSREA